MKLEFQLLYSSSKATSTQAESSKLITGNATQMELESLTLKFLYIYLRNCHSNGNQVFKTRFPLETFFPLQKQCIAP